ncbi:hypothetical protein [Metapseudomonas otitidis]|uniref:hypothetical protein n=1 Tax=Metapseudomonas otitidis TaxID=319939 RepID=UPI0013F6281F|nr:hypothetical protein [Pseudomonas otitidis]
MTLNIDRKTARLSGQVSVEDAEALFDWLRSTPKAKLDLKACTHLHAANLQVLMATRPTIAHWPADTDLANWLRRALATPDKERPHGQDHPDR